MSDNDQVRDRPFRKLSTPRSSEQRDTATESEAAKLAKFLLGCFRRAEADDPEVFAAGVLRIFSCYPLDVGAYVCDPVTGLPGKLKWLPTMAEVKAACDEHAFDLAKLQRFENWGKQIGGPDAAERKAIEAKRPTAHEMEEKYGKGYGLRPEPIEHKRLWRAPTIDDLTEHYKGHELGRKKKDLA